MQHCQRHFADLRLQFFIAVYVEQVIAVGQVLRQFAVLRRISVHRHALHDLQAALAQLVLVREVDLGFSRVVVRIRQRDPAHFRRVRCRAHFVFVVLHVLHAGVHVPPVVIRYGLRNLVRMTKLDAARCRRVYLARARFFRRQHDFDCRCLVFVVNARRHVFDLEAYLPQQRVDLIFVCSRCRDRFLDRQLRVDCALVRELHARRRRGIYYIKNRK